MASTMLSLALRRTAVRCTSQMMSCRTFVSASVVLSDDLPYHLVVGLPALSPTMESGSLAEWYVEEGGSFVAGDAIAKIETDKASIDFEAQDDGFVARLLMEAGQGNDIKVGTPIMITVEEEDHVAAFKDYIPPAGAVEAAPAPAAEATPPPPSPPAAAAKEPEVAAAAKSEAPPPPPPPPSPAATPPSPPPRPAPAATAPTPEFAVAWGAMAAAKSPLAKTLSKKQQAYLDKYGTTGQLPL